MSKLHQSNAPPKIDEIPIIETNKVVVLLMNSNRANKAIKRKRINGLDNVRPKEVKKSPGRLCFTVSLGFGWVAGLLWKMYQPKNATTKLPTS